MKSPQLLLGLFLALFALSLSAQTTGFNYQAVLRNNNFAPIANQAGTATVSILNPVGTELYRETHNITTDQLGLFNLVIGKGSNPVGDFAGVDWGSGGRFVKIVVNANGNNYDFFPSELQAVPYAKVAEKALQGDGDAQTLSLNGQNLSISNGNTVALPTGTDAQTLSLNGQTLSISNGNSVNLPAGGSGWTDGTALTTTALSKRLGIGTSNPQQKVHIHDQDQSFAWLQMTSDNSGATAGDGAFVGTVGSELKIENCEPGNITLGNCSNVNQLVVTPAGNVEIAGQVKIAGGLPGAGKVLTSDASGNATWSMPSASGWTDGNALTTTGLSKKVGIGTADPLQKLHIHDSSQPFAWLQMTHSNTGTTAGDGGAVGIFDSNLEILNCEEGDFLFAYCTDFTPKLSIKRSGHVVISGSQSTEGLTVNQGGIGVSDYGNISTNLGAIYTRNGSIYTDNGSIYTEKGDITTKYGNISAYRYGDGFGPGLTFYQANVTGAAPSKTLIGDNLGNISFLGYGIGSIVSGAFITARATQNFSNTSGTKLQFGTASNNSVGVATRMEINQDGRVGIHMGGDAPQAWLHINDAGATSDERLIQAGDDSYLADIDQSNFLGVYGVQDANVGGIRLGKSGVEMRGENGRLYINSMFQFNGGDVQWNGSTGEIGYDNSSSRYKENITPLVADFKKILLAEPRTYTRPGRPGIWEIGFIAEDFQKIGLDQLLLYDKEGQVDGIQYRKISTFLIPVMREQQATIEAQQAEITALKAQLEARDARENAILSRLEKLEAAMEKLR